MKKVLLLSLVACTPLFAASQSSNSDIEELVREHNGKIEELEHRIKYIENKLGINSSEAVSLLNSSKVTADSIKNKTPESVIEMAKDYIREDQTENARAALDLYLKNNPKNIYFGMMHYYIGKSYLLEKNYVDATKAFMYSFELNPNGKKAPNALYGLAISFLRLNKKEQMKTTLEKLISSYPSSNKAKKAKNLLKK